MQSLTKCSRRHYVASNRIFNFSSKNVYFPKEKLFLDVNRLSCAYNNGAHRLFLPVSYHAYKKIRKEFYAVQSALFHSNISKFSFSPRFDNIRYFNTSTCSNSNKQSPKKSDPENPDKEPDKNEEMKSLLSKLSMWFLLLYVLLFALRQQMDTSNAEPTASISWNEFVYHMLSKGEVEAIIVNPSIEHVIIVVHDGAIIKGRRSMYKRYHMAVPNIENFEEKLRKVEKDLGIKAGQGVQVIYERKIEYMASVIRFLLIALVAFAAFSFMKKRFSFKPFEFFSQMKQAKFTLVEPLMGKGKGVHFADVAGLKEAKIEVMEFVDYLKHPERYKILGAKVPQGALLLGPPGCGKTMLAKAVATEANVPFLSMNGSEFIEVFGGLGAARVRDLFKEAKKRAPSIIYIDEIDAIGKKRSESSRFGNSESERTLNQLLVEMDGMISKENVIILASTNRAEVLDKALLRPGRFDRHILIDLPTLAERQQIFETHLMKISLHSEPSKYSEYLAYLTPGFSGADIANVCNEAALHAARDKKKQVASSDLMYAIDRTIGGLTKRNNPLTPATKRIVAFHEAGHALVGWLLEHTDALLKVTIVPRTNLRLGFAQYTQSDQKLYSKEELFEQICMMLGGRVAEYITFNKISTGAEDDLKKVTRTAYLQVTRFGMSPAVGLISFNQEVTDTTYKKLFSKKLHNLIDAEVRKIIGEAHERTQQLLLDNKDKLDKLAEALLEKETLTYDDVEKLIGPPPFGKKRLVEPAEFEKSNLARESSSVDRITA